MILGDDAVQIRQGVFVVVQSEVHCWDRLLFSKIVVVAIAFAR